MSRDHEEPCPSCGGPSPWGRKCRACRDQERAEYLQDREPNMDPPDEDDDWGPEAE